MSGHWISGGSVGDGVGSEDGELVGTPVGDCVGSAEGDQVGADVPSVMMYIGSSEPKDEYAQRGGGFMMTTV